MILILSKDFDESTNDVIDWLYFYKAIFFRINGNDYLDSKFNYTYSLNNKTPNQLKLGCVDFNTVKAVWYRRWISYNNTFNELIEDFDAKDKSTIADIKNNIVQETRKSYKPFFDLIKNVNVFSLPNMNSMSLNKMDVLLKAKAIGLNIPNTIICNNKIDLLEFFKNNSLVITKPLSEVITYEGQEDIYFTRTSLITVQEVESFGDCFFPSLFQKYIDKDIEIRVFYINSKFYPMAIFSQDDEQTRIDFRNYNLEDPNRTVPFKLPIEIENKLDVLMKNLKLNTGSLDLILGTDSQFYFLEVNPVGQFGMTSYPCNYYIEKIIAKTLVDHEK